MEFQAPPRHRVDASITFVHPRDEAWDAERVEASIEEHGDASPWRRYYKGTTRFDISAQMEQGSVEDFLTKGGETRYVLRRLSAIELNEVQSSMEREFSQGFPTPRKAYVLAARYGLVAVKDANGRDLVELSRRGGQIAEADVDLLSDCTPLGVELLIDLGQAAYLASQPLRPDEKKG